VVRRFAVGRWLVRTPLDHPVLILFLMTLVSLYPSVDLTLSLPKLFGLFLGFSVYYATVSSVSSQRRFWLGVSLLPAGIVAVSLLGLVGTEWIVGKYPWLQLVYSLLPRVIRGIQTSVGPAMGFHPNELGGTLAFLLPLPLALLVRAPLSSRQRVALGATVLLGLGVLALSASRSASLGLSVAVLLLVIWRWRRPGLVLLVVALAALVAVFSLNAPAITDFLLRVDAASVAPGMSTLPSRMEIWGRARDLIEVFPFTGIGLNTFPVVFDSLYPPLLLAGISAKIPHAHNIFLQTTIDLGLGGLLAFLGLWVCVARAAWLAHRSAQPAVQAAVMGMLLGFFSYLVFGLTDAITLGAKPTVLLWLMMGLIVAALHLGQTPEADLPGQSPGPSRSHLVGSILSTLGGLYWAIAYVLLGLGYLIVGLGISGWMP
jgi:O-antigen ligase